MTKWQCKILIVLGLLLSPWVAIAAPAVLQRVTFSDAPGASRLQMVFNQAVPYRVFSLSHPDRLVLDFKNNPKVAISLATIAFNNPDIKVIRSGHPLPQVLRLVVEMKTSLKQFKVISQPNATQVMVDLITPTTSQNTVVDKQTVTKSALDTALVTNTPPSTVPAEQPEINVDALQSALSSMPSKSVSPMHPIVVVIDPGHGGKDPGAIGIHGTKEKDVVLAIAQQLAKFINSQLGMRAVLTRKGDYFVPLRDRLRLARKGKADIFIAIHADSYFNKHSNGVSVYALSQRGATSEAARWLARRDNDSELGGVNLSGLEDQSYLLRSVLIDLAQTATITDSLRLGSGLLRSLDVIATLHYPHVEQAPFVVLKSPDIPSVLVETGFISNADEELRLKNPVYQSKIAQALFKGVNHYAKRYLALNRQVIMVS